jgi:hypothetical protein
MGGSCSLDAKALHVTADLRERFELVTEFAGKLRASGVTDIEIDGIKIALAPPPRRRPAVLSPEVLAGRSRALREGGRGSRRGRSLWAAAGLQVAGLHSPA